jgi:hypothetical protein
MISDSSVFNTINRAELTGQQMSQVCDYLSADFMTI